MNNLTIINHNGQKTIDSREVAEIIDRPHYDLMKTIRQYCEYLTQGEIPFSKFFIESTYQDSTGRTLPCFMVTEMGCDMIANKLTGEKGTRFTAAYVAKFHEMKADQPQFYIPKSLSEALQLAADQAKQLELQAPKVEYAEALLASDDDLGMKEAADALAIPGMGRNNLFKFLVAKNVLIDSYHAYREHIDGGHFRQVPRPYTNLKTGEREIGTQIRVTPKGLDYIRKLIKRGI